MHSEAILILKYFYLYRDLELLKKEKKLTLVEFEYEKKNYNNVFKKGYENEIILNPTKFLYNNRKNNQNEENAKKSSEMNSFNKYKTMQIVRSQSNKYLKLSEDIDDLNNICYKAKYGFSHC